MSISKRFSTTDPETRLHHLDVYRDTGWKVDVGEGFDDLWSRVQNVDHALVDAHLELLAGILVDECGAVHGVLLDINRERHWADYLCVVASGGIDYLLHRIIQNAVLVGSDFYAKAMRRFGFFGSAGRRGRRRRCGYGCRS